MCRTRMAPVVLVFSMGCFPEVEFRPPSINGGGGSATPGDTATISPAVELSVSIAEPFHGSNMGGLETYISGGPFDTSVEVWFGEEPAEILAVTESELRVVVPESEVVGPVSIVVRTDGGEGEMALGFRYWEDQTDKTVMTGILLQSTWVGPGSESHMAAATLVQTEPGTKSILDVYGEVGSCSTVSSALNTVTMPDEAELKSSMAELNLRWDGSSLYYSSNDQDPDLRDTTFAMTVPTGGYPQINLDSAISLSPGIWLSSPDIDVTYSFDNKDLGDAVTWSGGSGEWVLLSLYDDGDSNAVLHCIVENDGSHRVTGDMLHAAGFESEVDCRFNDEWSYVCGDQFAAYIRLLDLNQTLHRLDFNHGLADLWGASGVLGFSYLWDQN